MAGTAGQEHEGQATCDTRVECLREEQPEVHEPGAAGRAKERAKRPPAAGQMSRSSGAGRSATGQQEQISHVMLEHDVGQNKVASVSP